MYTPATYRQSPLGWIVDTSMVCWPQWGLDTVQADNLRGFIPGSFLYLIPTSTPSDKAVLLVLLIKVYPESENLTLYYLKLPLWSTPPLLAWISAFMLWPTVGLSPECSQVVLRPKPYSLCSWRKGFRFRKLKREEVACIYGWLTLIYGRSQKYCEAVFLQLKINKFWWGGKVSKRLPRALRNKSRVMCLLGHCLHVVAILAQLSNVRTSWEMGGSQLSCS